MQLAGKNTRIAGKNTAQTPAKKLQTQEKNRTIAGKNLQFHTELHAIAGNLLSHRG